AVVPEAEHVEALLLGEGGDALLDLPVEHLVGVLRVLEQERQADQGRLGDVRGERALGVDRHVQGAGGDGDHHLRVAAHGLLAEDLDLDLAVGLLGHQALEREGALGARVPGGRAVAEDDAHRVGAAGAVAAGAGAEAEAREPGQSGAAEQVAAAWGAWRCHGGPPEGQGASSLSLGRGRSGRRAPARREGFGRAAAVGAQESGSRSRTICPRRRRASCSPSLSATPRGSSSRTYVPVNPWSSSVATRAAKSTSPAPRERLRSPGTASRRWTRSIRSPRLRAQVSGSSAEATTCETSKSTPNCSGAQRAS